MHVVMTAIAGHTIYSRSGKLEMGMPVAIVSIAAASSLLLASSLMLHYSTDSFFTKAAQLREDLD